MIYDISFSNCSLQQKFLLNFPSYMWALNEGDMHFVSVHILKLMSSFGPPGNHIQGNILHTPGQLIPKPAQCTSSHVHQKTEYFSNLCFSILKDEIASLFILLYLILILIHFQTSLSHLNFSKLPERAIIKTSYICLNSNANVLQIV